MINLECEEGDFGLIFRWLSLFPKSISVIVRTKIRDAADIYMRFHMPPALLTNKLHAAAQAPTHARYVLPALHFSGVC